MSQSEGDDRGKGHLILDDVHQLPKDLRLLERAISKRWGIPAEEKPGIIARLLKVVAKEHTVRLDKQGNEVFDDERADVNAIAAARVLVMIEGQDQADEHKFIDKKIPDASNETQLPLADAISHPKYLEYLEASHMAGNRHASPVGDMGQPGQVEASETPASSEQGTD